MAWRRNRNSSYFGNTSSASGGGGSVSGTDAPGGPSLGKPIGFVNDDPIGHNTSAARPFGGFGMGSGSYSAKSAGVGGPVGTQSGRSFRPRFFRRRAGGFAGLQSHYLPNGPLSGIFSGSSPA